MLNLLERKTLAKFVKINVDEMHNKSCLRVEVFAEGSKYDLNTSIIYFKLNFSPLTTGTYNFRSSTLHSFSISCNSVFCVLFFLFSQTKSPQTLYLSFPFSTHRPFVHPSIHPPVYMPKTSAFNPSFIPSISLYHCLVGVQLPIFPFIRLSIYLTIYALYSHSFIYSNFFEFFHFVLTSIRSGSIAAFNFQFICLHAYLPTYLPTYIHTYIFNNYPPKWR